MCFRCDPGITSPASVLYRDEENMLSGSRVMDTYLGEILPSKLRLDQLYVRHHTFWGDLDIIFWTLLILIPTDRQVYPAGRIALPGTIFAPDEPARELVPGGCPDHFPGNGRGGPVLSDDQPAQCGVGDRRSSWRWVLRCYISLTNFFLGVNQIVWSKATAVDAIDLIPGASDEHGDRFVGQLLSGRRAFGVSRLPER